MNTNVIAALVVAVLAIAAACALAVLDKVSGADALTLISGLAVGGLGAGAVHLGQTGTAAPPPRSAGPPMPSTAPPPPLQPPPA